MVFHSEKPWGQWRSKPTLPTQLHFPWIRSRFRFLDTSLDQQWESSTRANLSATARWVFSLYSTTQASITRLLLEVFIKFKTLASTENHHGTLNRQLLLWVVSFEKTHEQGLPELMLPMNDSDGCAHLSYNFLQILVHYNKFCSDPLFSIACTDDRSKHLTAPTNQQLAFHNSYFTHHQRNIIIFD